MVQWLRLSSQSKGPGFDPWTGNHIPQATTKDPACCNEGETKDVGLIPGLGRASGDGKGNPLQYSCLENSMKQRSLVGYNLWGRKELGTTE